MARFAFRLSDDLAADIDRAARYLRINRTQWLVQACAYYLGRASARGDIADLQRRVKRLEEHLEERAGLRR